MLSSATKIDNSPAVADCGLRVTWFFGVGGTAEMGWDWQRLGAPAVEQLTPVRMPRSSASNRHIPVTAYSMTNGGVLHLESGLEHDLVRRLEPDTGVRIGEPERATGARRPKRLGRRTEHWTRKGLHEA